MKNILKIHDKLQTIDKNLYIVWGYCREKIMWNENEGDIDLVSEATPVEVQKVLNVVWEIGKKYGTCIVSEWGETFELTTFREDIGSVNYRKPAEVKFTHSLEIDAKRRDFSCNAIYYDPKRQEYIDPELGRKDIENKLLRFVGNIEERIQEDALRILRCIRFKNRYGFSFADESYWEILKKNIKILTNLPIERIRQELDKMLLDPSNTRSLEDLKTIGFLDIFLPELACLDKYPGNKWHMELDVWIHTKMCVEEMNTIIERETSLDEKTKLLLLWSILLHDIGKWPTYSVWEDGEGHYYDHEHVWAEMFQGNIVKRLKFSNSFSERISFIITEHLRVFKIPTMKKFKARKLMMHKYFDELLLVWEADNKWRIPQKLDTFNEILKIYSEFKELLKTKTFLTGEDIMKKYPALEWRELWERLKQLNDQILVDDT